MVDNNLDEVSYLSQSTALSTNIWSKFSRFIRYNNANFPVCFSPGPAHKITYAILKEKFPNFNSIVWRDG